GVGIAVFYDCGMGAKHIDWKIVQQFVDEGNGLTASQKRFGFSHTAWVKALKRGELVVPRPPGAVYRDRRRKYDWAAVQRFYDDGNSYLACCAVFGFCAASWTKAVRRGELHARARRLTIEQLFERPRASTTVKRH